MQDINNISDSSYKNSVVPWNLLDVCLIVVLYLIITLVTAFTFKFFGIDYKNAAVVVFATVLLSVLPIFSIFIIIKYLYKVSFVKFMGLTINKQLMPKYFWGGCYLFFLISLSTLLISFFWQHILKAPIVNPYSSFGSEKLQVISLLAIFIAPVFEELFFRGFIQPAVTKTFGTVAGVFIVAIVFTFLHKQYIDNVLAISVLLSLSLILGFSRVYFNSVIPAIVAHTLNNCVAAIGILIGKG